MLPNYTLGCLNLMKKPKHSRYRPKRGPLYNFAKNFSRPVCLLLSLLKNPTNCRDVDFANEERSNMTKENSGSGRKEASRLSVKERRSKGLAHQALQTYEQRKPEEDHVTSEISAEVVEHITDKMFSLNNQLVGAQRSINNKIVLFCAPLLAINAWIGIWAWT